MAELDAEQGALRSKLYGDMYVRLSDEWGCQARLCRVKALTNPCLPTPPTS